MRPGRNKIAIYMAPAAQLPQGARCYAHALPAFEQCVSGPPCDVAVHTHTHTRTPTQTRAYKGACFNISSGHTQVWFPPCDACNHNKERKMLKITFNSSNTWGRQAETTYQWLKPCRGNWAVPVLINGSDSPKRRWSATPPTTGAKLS